jgi:hypothetical protein
MPPLQERYFDVLMERVRNDRYPSLQLMDRLESMIYTPDQVTQYVDVLIQKIDETWYPSGQIMNRLERMMRLAALAVA